MSHSLLIFCLLLFVSSVSAQAHFPALDRDRGTKNLGQRLLTKLGRPRGLENRPGTVLNTRRKETEREREQRLDGEIPEADEEEEPNIEEIYNPMRDAKCFNAPYDTSLPLSKRRSLFSDYVRIFEWGFNMDGSSPIFSFSENGVTNNRFPGMCIRMAFHDNSVDPKHGEFSSYIARRINADNEWTGPPRFLETSGGDASVLTCRIERLHPNQNYDQTASRILYAFQTAIVPGLNGQSLMDKYRMSYADALHNCALAAISFLNPKQGGAAKKRMRFGRKDACYFSEDPDLAEDILSMGGNNPLCGPTELLPPVTFSASESNHWFTSRRMHERLWLSFMGTHTTFDNFGRNDTLRQMPVPGEDYFANYLGVPVHSPDVKEVEEDAELSGCDWVVNGVERFWPMSQADCALGIDVIDTQRNLRRLKWVMNRYIAAPASWIRRDLACAIIHLGGRVNEHCGGSNSLFGSVY